MYYEIRDTLSKKFTGTNEGQKISCVVVTRDRLNIICMTVAISYQERTLTTLPLHYTHILNKI